MGADEELLIRVAQSTPLRIHLHGGRHFKLSSQRNLTSSASPHPMPPHHDHGGGVEFAIAHELAAHGLAGGLI